MSLMQRINSMSRKSQAPPGIETKGARGGPAAKRRPRSVNSAKQVREGSDLEKTLALIKARPGIRPSEINRLLNREESDGLRATLIKRGLIRKERDGSATRYFPV
jgi:hypothetical protein